MTQTSDNNKRIAKNTLLLYVRMIFLLLISLFTSRVVLRTLGVEDYGIYNVVGGVVTMFTFLNTAMAGATQRFLNFDLAKNNVKELNETFNTSLLIHSIIAVIVIILAETIGLWFLYNKMVIPAERYGAALWVFQCSILTMVIGIMSVPYNAVIIAHEKMSAFAYISLLEAVMKLAIVYMLLVSEYDKLKVYATLLLGVSIIIRIVYSSYSNKHFSETKIKFIWNSEKMRRMGTFASWNLIGNLALMGVTQGLNMVLNVFFGPVINAARGVAVQVQNAILQFASSFQTAINPQITKSFAVGDYPYMHSLICRGAKFSFFLVFLLSLPILVMTNQILVYWLEKPPLYSATFLQIIIITALVDCLSNPLNNAINASGKIRSFQLTNGIIMLMVIPVAIIVLYMDKNPCWVFVVQLALTILTHFLKLWFTKKKTGLPFRIYLKKVYIPCFLVIIMGTIIPYAIHKILDENIYSFCIIGMLSICSVCIAIYTIGLENSERSVILHKIYSVVQKSKS